MSTDDFPARVRAARERMMMTRPQFARLVQVSEKTVQNWESGASTPRNRMGALEQYLSPDTTDAATAGGLAAVEQRVRESGLFSGAQVEAAVELAKKSFLAERAREGTSQVG